MGNRLVFARVTLPEGVDLVTFARPTDADGNVLFAADVSTVRVYCYDLDSSNAVDPYYTATLTVGDVMETGPSTATLGWKPDDVGYSFRHTLSASNLSAEGVRRYRVEYRLDTVSDGMVPVVDIVTIAPLGSA